MTRKTVTAAILGVLRRGPKRGLTAEVIAERAGTRLSSTRTVLSSLASDGQITVVGTEARQFRPANLYAISR